MQTVKVQQQINYQEKTDDTQKLCIEFKALVNPKKTTDKLQIP